MTPFDSTLALTAKGCAARQQRLRDVLVERHLDAALITDRRYVHYFTGYWCRSIFSPIVLIERDGSTTLVTPLPDETAPCADRVIAYESNHYGTLVDDQHGAALTALGDLSSRKIGRDDDGLAPALLAMRRRKDADELAMLQRAVDAAGAAYARAYAMLEPGVDEVELYAAMQAAAVTHVGEMIGEFGNDYQIGATGGAPRRRPALPGEMAVLDVSVVVRGYAGDMCRSFIVGEANAAQRDAHELLVGVLNDVVATIRPGTSCRAIDAEMRATLDGYRGWQFKHHLGHGIGLANHEAPRINPHADDRFEVGDVFTIEPGLYGEDLRAGLRIEEVYHLEPAGPVKLTHFSTDL